MNGSICLYRVRATASPQAQQHLRQELKEPTEHPESAKSRNLTMVVATIAAY
jgi:hypothetical protein